LSVFGINLVVLFDKRVHVQKAKNHWAKTSFVYCDTPRNWKKCINAFYGLCLSQNGVSSRFWVEIFPLNVFLLLLYMFQLSATVLTMHWQLTVCSESHQRLV